jgi:hypothetical protein
MKGTILSVLKFPFPRMTPYNAQIKPIQQQAAEEIVSRGIIGKWQEVVQKLRESQSYKSK